MRLLPHLKEVEEPFEEKQVGSSRDALQAQPDAVRADDALARWLLSPCSDNGQRTHAAQWFERTLDDSREPPPRARRGVPRRGRDPASCWDSVADGLVVNPGVVRRRLDAEVPFIATENILMAAVKKGGDRQTLHERSASSRRPRATA